ncbi:MAG: hypothetical protein ACRENQ_01375, partial [Gemmatimonadaceae bacterium]
MTTPTAPAPVPAPGARILVVDDEADIVDSIERQFRKKYKILKATSGMEALRVLQSEQVHLI